jgi:hypothetical protein
MQVQRYKCFDTNFKLTLEFVFKVLHACFPSGLESSVVSHAFCFGGWGTIQCGLAGALRVCLVVGLCCVAKAA